MVQFHLEEPSSGDELLWNGAVEWTGFGVGDDPALVGFATPLCWDPATVLRWTGVGNIDVSVPELAAERW
ncbi:hypothetical protein C452_01890 [Haloferax volcanii JCM 10717]|uniref:Uncharacterized protein n=1 Tax=Haloferax volcanii JCM 10717 TaxID=1227458 RepID=M0IEC1_HALVO|nr:hypothetical protein C452_01890 [Haloferax alexandrinus JCM 10717]